MTFTYPSEHLAIILVCVCVCMFLKYWFLVILVGRSLHSYALYCLFQNFSASFLTHIDLTWPVFNCRTLEYFSKFLYCLPTKSTILPQFPALPPYFLLMELMEESVASFLGCWIFFMSTGVHFLSVAQGFCTSTSFCFLPYCSLSKKPQAPVSAFSKTSSVILCSCVDLFRCALDTQVYDAQVPQLKKISLACCITSIHLLNVRWLIITNVMKW